MASGSAIIGKSFEDGTGFSTLGAVSQEIAVLGSASDSIATASATLDAEASDSMAQSPFPISLPPSPVKKATKKKTNKKASDAQSVAPISDAIPDIAMDYETVPATDSLAIFHVVAATTPSGLTASASIKTSHCPIKRGSAGPNISGHYHDYG
jgi:hypothetical protein